MLRSDDQRPLGSPCWQTQLLDKMTAEVSTVVRTRSENDVVTMDVSVIKGKGGKGKDDKSKEGKVKESKGEDEGQRRQGQV